MMSFLALLALLFWIAIVPLGLAYLIRHRNRLWSRRLALLAIGLALLQFTLWIYDAGGWQRLKHFKELNNLLRDSTWQTFTQLGLTRDESMATMATLSEGLVSWSLRYPEQKTQLSPMIDRMISMAFRDHFRPTLSNRRRWADQWVYLAHLNILLGNYRRVGGDDRFEQLHKALSEFLANGIVKSPYKNMYANYSPVELHPGDNAVALASLAYYDKCYGTDTSAKPIRDWVNYVLKELTFQYGDLPCALVTRENRCKEVPTSSTLGPLIANMAVSDRPAAKTVWREYKHYFKEGWMSLSATFNEFSPSVVNPDDIDLEEPTAEENRLATLQALRAAAYAGDELTYYQLNNHFVVKDIMSEQPRRWNRFRIMATSLRFAAESYHKGL